MGFVLSCGLFNTIIASYQVYVDRLHRGALLSYCVVVHDALVLVAGTCGTFFRRGGKSYYIRVQVHGREVVGGFGSSWRSRNLDRRFARDRAISNSSKSGLDVVAGRMSKTGDVPVVISENLSAVDTSSSDNVKARPQVCEVFLYFLHAPKVYMLVFRSIHIGWLRAVGALRALSL